MQGLKFTLPLWLAACWAISLTTLGLFVVPMLFVHLPSPAMAGAMAARLFSVQTSISVACALGLLLYLRKEKSGNADASEEAKPLAVWLLGGALLALLVEFAIAPRIVARDNLALWHRVGSLMYFGQWVCALVVFQRLAFSSGRASCR